ncbi:MAG: hypothetical protein H8E16_11155, partial [Flavobacteriales bacterium]|nr:hypothetical protein [Flavobacteriales bacterium]
NYLLNLHKIIPLWYEDVQLNGKDGIHLATRFEGHTMDSMLMRNSVTGNEMWLVNKVDEISDEEIDKYMKK